MDILLDYLPKDLVVNITEEYAQDSTIYDKVIKQYRENLDQVCGFIAENCYNFYPRRQYLTTEDIMNIICQDKHLYEDFLCIVK